MPILKYLGTEITVHTERTGRETAHLVADGVAECFLNGLIEAKTFLKKRKQGLHYGPRAARYEVYLEGRLNSSCRDRAAALGDLHYWQRENRPATIVRTEYCPAPGCDDGEIFAPPTGRARFGSRRRCACHVVSESTTESPE